MFVLSLSPQSSGGSLSPPLPPKPQSDDQVNTETPLAPPSDPQPVDPSLTPPSDPPMEDEPLSQRTVEVAIPQVGTFVIESEEGGYDDEVALDTQLTQLTLLWCAEKSLCLFGD